jgi:hypothetical protein
MTELWVALTAVGTLATAAIVFWQLRLIRLTLGVESILRLDEAWQSLSSTRRCAAKQLLEGNAGADVDKILDFLNTVALLTRRKAIDEEFAWHTFYWAAANYWSASQDYVRLVQREEGGATWQDLQRLIPKMQQIEARKSSRSAARLSPSQEQTRAFLTDEAKIEPPFSR